MEVKKVITPDLFWYSLDILITKPHVTNKRLWGNKVLRQHECKVGSKAWDISVVPSPLADTDNVDEYLDNLLQHMDTQILNCNENVDIGIILWELLPRKYLDKHAFQLIVVNKKGNSVTFYDVTPKTHEQNLCPNFTYCFQLHDNEFALVTDADVNSKAYQWVITSVLPQLNKWSEDTEQYVNMPVHKSLGLVQQDLYYNKYKNLKEKYGKHLIEIWQESTDPYKFVYEDIAIATYLLLLWEKKKDHSIVKPQSFVDLGCGNGLLVYILTMEGHHGYGVDVRKRKIWNLYPSNIKLLEMTVTPSNISTFTEVDWIIGNHSDELTPWIPVITAKSSYKCNFFLLPCCAYNFDGTKYQRQDSGKSQYTEYLEYIHGLCNYCGFETQIDRLKIPSTKRICLIGENRKYLEEEYSKYSEIIDTLIKSSVSKCIENYSMNATDNFKARKATERVRNCTQIDKAVIDCVITIVAKHLLKDCNLESKWFAGHPTQISELIPLLSQDTLKVLKSECGGLQTLLKNNNHVFKVKNGIIQLRHPRTVEETNNVMKTKKPRTTVKLQIKQCWFYNNHPQGCPLSDTVCSFLHFKI